MILVQTKNLVSLRRLLVTMHMRPALGSKLAIASYPTALRDEGLNAATASGVGMPHAKYLANETFDLSKLTYEGNRFTNTSRSGTSPDVRFECHLMILGPFNDRPDLVRVDG